LHAETILPISFRHIILPQRFPLATDLLDLQPLPVHSIADVKAKKLFSGFKYFNPIQTQTFNALYETDSNVLLCAPSGSGKTVCAELALFRLLQNSADGKCVYIASRKVRSKIILLILSFFNLFFFFRKLSKILLQTGLLNSMRFLALMLLF
jgi:pre-mRNA-splicing helicase BRR2